jgi:pre-mRNA-splicing factor CWC26
VSVSVALSITRTATNEFGCLVVAAGRRLDTLETFLEISKRASGEKPSTEATQMEWGKGAVQVRDQEARLKELAEQIDKPFARTIDDVELNRDLQAVDRWGDPMAGLVKSKSKSDAPSRPVYSGPPPPANRWNIQPGHRWDGVDRSNGWEAKLFKIKAAKRAQNAAAYKWSVEDM